MEPVMEPTILPTILPTDYKFDALISPYDNRDWFVGNFLVTSGNNIDTKYPSALPETFTYQNIAAPIRDQGNLGSCVAHAVASIVEIHTAKEKSLSSEGKVNNYHSPGYIYASRTGIQEGMNGRDGLNIATKQGVPLERDFPYTGRDDKQRGVTIPEWIHNNAKNFKIKGYARVNTIDDAKEAIIKYGPLYAIFYTYDPSHEYFWKNPKGRDHIGFHAISIYGWNSEGFIIRNSWGEKWANKGYGTYPFSHWPSHQDLFSTIDMVSEKVDVLPDNFDTSEKEDKKKCGGCFII